MKHIKDLQATEFSDALEASRRLIIASEELNKYFHNPNEAIDYETVLPLLTSVKYFYEQVSELCVRYSCMEEINASVEGNLN